MNGASFYPHPVLGPGDDVAGHFKVGVPSVYTEKNRTIIRFNELSVGNETLEEMIDCGSAAIAVKLECAKTMFRRVFKMQSDLLAVDVDADKLDGRVEVSIELCANSPIENYRPQGLNPDYGEAEFELDTGSVLAIGGKFSFIADSEDETTGVQSWIQVKPSENVNSPITVDFDTNRITVNLSVEDWKSYSKIEQHSPSIIHAGVVFPVVVEAVRRVQLFQNDSESISIESCKDARWFTILRHLLEVTGDISSNDPFSAASVILKHPLRRTWISLQGRLEVDRE